MSGRAEVVILPRKTSIFYQLGLQELVINWISWEGLGLTWLIQNPGIKCVELKCRCTQIRQPLPKACQITSIVSTSFFNNLLPLLQQLHGFRTTFSNRFTFFATDSLFYWNRTRNQNNDSRMKQRLSNCWCLCWIVVVSCSITQQLFDARGGLSGSHPVCP